MNNQWQPIKQTLSTYGLILKFLFITRVYNPDEYRMAIYWVRWNPLSYLLIFVHFVMSVISEGVPEAYRDLSEDKWTWILNPSPPNKGKV